MSETATSAPAPSSPAPAAEPSTPAATKTPDNGVVERPGKSDRKAINAALKEHIAAQARESKVSVKAEPEKPKESAPERPEPKADKPKESAPEKREPGKAESRDQQERPAAEKPEPKRESDAELHASRALREARAAKAEALDYRRKHEQADTELKTLRSKLEKAKAQPLDFMEDELGYTLEKLTREIVDGKVKPRSKRAELPPEMQKEWDELKAERQQRKEQEETQAKQAQRQRDEGAITTYFKSNPDTYPLLAASPWAISEVVERAYRSNARDAEPIIQQMEAGLAKNLTDLLGNERAAKALLKSNPKLRAAMSALMADESKTAPTEASKRSESTNADSPRSASSLSSSSPSVDPSQLSKADRKKRANEGFKSFLAGRK